MSKRAVLVLRLLVAWSSFVLFLSGTAQAQTKPEKDPIPQGYEINPYGCLGRYETATKDRTTAQMELEVKRKLDPLFEPEDPHSIRAMKLCVVAMLKSRLGHMDAAEYYQRAIEEQPFEPGYELWAGNYYSGFRGAHRPVVELAERHYYAGLRKLEELDRKKKRRHYHDVVEDWIRKRMLLLYQEDGMPILPWKAYPQSSSGLNAPGLSLGVMAGISKDTRPFNRRGDNNEMRTFSGEANFADSDLRAGGATRPVLGRGLTDLEIYDIARAPLRMEVDAKARFRQRYFGALDFRFFQACAPESQIISFYFPTGFYAPQPEGVDAQGKGNIGTPCNWFAKDAQSRSQSFADTSVREMNLNYERVFPLYPLFDFRLAGGVGKGQRIGVVEFLPFQKEDYYIYQVMPSFSHFLSTDKVSLDLVWAKLDFVDPEIGPTMDRQREKVIRGVKLDYAFYSPVVLPQLGYGSLRPYRTPTRGIHLYAGGVLDEETYGSHTVAKQDIYGGFQYRAPVNFNWLLQGTYLTARGTFADPNTIPAQVYNDPTQDFTGWRTSTYAEIRVIDPEALPTTTGSFLSPDMLNIVFPVSHDIALGDSRKDYENIRGGVQAWFQVFGTGFLGPAFLFTAGYDFQYFYNISKGFHLFSLNARVGWGEL